MRRIHDELLAILGQALAIRQVDAGSCNGCELEIHALNNPYYNIEGLGIRFVASPRHADMLLVTGPVSRHMELALRRTADRVDTQMQHWRRSSGDGGVPGQPAWSTRDALLACVGPGAGGEAVVLVAESLAPVQLVVVPCVPPVLWLLPVLPFLPLLALPFLVVRFWWRRESGR